MKYAIEAEELNVNHDQTSILWDVSFQIPKGVLVGLLGPNGAGKSTLLKVALGLIKPLSGKITLSGNVAYVPQRETIDWDFPITAEEVVLMGRYGKLGLFRSLKRADREAAAAALEQVGLGAYKDRQISQFSGGQQQRLFIARALVQNADLFLLDEPFAGVDLATEKAIMDLLRKQKEQGKTILIVHHDLPTVPEYFDWALLLNNRLHGCGPVKEIFNRENLSKAFGKNQALFDEAAHLSVKRMSGVL
jgi:manganese/zinc/iron transport system ATP- binding protein